MNSDGDNSFSGMNSNDFSGMSATPGVDISGLSGLNGYSDTGATMADTFAAAQDNLTAAGLASTTHSDAVGLDQIAESDPNRSWNKPSDSDKPLEPAAPVPGSIGSVTSVPPLPDNNYAPDLDLATLPSNYSGTVTTADEATAYSGAPSLDGYAAAPSSYSAASANSYTAPNTNYNYNGNGYAAPSAGGSTSDSSASMPATNPGESTASSSSSNTVGNLATSASSNKPTVGVPSAATTANMPTSSTAKPTSGSDLTNSNTLPASNRQSTVYGANMRTPVVESGSNMPLMSGSSSSSASSMPNLTAADASRSRSPLSSYSNPANTNPASADVSSPSLSVPSATTTGNTASPSASSTVNTPTQPTASPSADAFAASQKANDPGKLPFMPVGNFTDSTALPPTTSELPKKMPEVSLGKSSKLKNPKLIIIVLSAVIGVLVVALIVFIVLFMQESEKEQGKKLIFGPPLSESTTDEDISGGEVSESVQSLSCVRELDSDALRSSWYEAESGSISASANFVGDGLRGINQSINLTYNSNEMAEIVKTEIEIDRTSFLEQIASVEPFAREYVVLDNTLAINTSTEDPALITAANASTFELPVDGEQVLTNLESIQSNYEAAGYVCMLE